MHKEPEVILAAEVVSPFLTMIEKYTMLCQSNESSMVLANSESCASELLVCTSCFRISTLFATLGFLYVR